MMIQTRETLLSALFVVFLICFVLFFKWLNEDTLFEERAKYETKCANQCVMRGRDYEFHPTEDELKHKLNRLTRRNRYTSPVDSCECK